MHESSRATDRKPQEHPLIHDVLGEKEAALAAFERAYQDRAVEFAQMTPYPPFRTIASEPRFDALMREIGLPR